MLATLTLHELLLGILVSLILIFLFIIGLLLYSFREYRSHANRQQWKEQIEAYLLDQLMQGPTDELQIDSKLQALMRQESFRRFFLGLLIASERKFSGAAVQTLLKIYDGYGLDKEAYNLLRSRSSHLIARGIQALTVMQDRQALPEIEQKINHYHPQVVQEVQYAMVSFKGFDGLVFMDQLDSMLSDWQQLRILNSITALPADGIDRLRIWLKSSNESVQILCLKFIRKFQLLSLHEDLFMLLGAGSAKLHEEAIKTIFSIEQSDSSTRLLAYFHQANQREQLAIITGLGDSRALDQISFLKQQLTQHADECLKIKSVETLVTLGQMNYLFELQRQLHLEDPTLHILNHTLQHKYE